MIQPGKGTQPEDTPWGPPIVHSALFTDKGGDGHGIYRTTNGLASWSLIMALLWGFGVFSLIAVIFGHAAMKQIRQRGQDGAEIAAVGLALGYLGLAVPALLIVLFLAGVASV